MLPGEDFGIKYIFDEACTSSSIDDGECSATRSNTTRVPFTCRSSRMSPIHDGGVLRFFFMNSRGILSPAIFAAVSTTFAKV